MLFLVWLSFFNSWPMDLDVINKNFNFRKFT